MINFKSLNLIENIVLGLLLLFLAVTLSPTLLISTFIEIVFCQDQTFVMKILDTPMGVFINKVSDNMRKV